MSDIYVESAAQLDGYVRALGAVPGQRGAVVAINGKVVGLELFDSPAAFSRYLEKLVRAYALDAIETQARELRIPSDTDAQAFLDLIWATHAQRFPALGEGEDIRLAGAGLAGGALLAAGRLVHLAAFVVP